MNDDDSTPVASVARTRFVVLVLVVAVFGAVILVLGPPDPEGLRASVANLGPAAPFLAVGGIALGILVMIPRTIMSIASGLLFGWLPGFAYIMIGCLLGASLGYALGRLLGRDFVADRLRRWGGASGGTAGSLRVRAVAYVQRRIALFDGWLGEHGVIGVWIARIIPLSHYGLLSYTCGTSSVGYRAFALGTLISSVHGALGYTAVGGAVLGEGGLPLALGLAIALNLFSVSILLIARRVMRRRGIVAEARKSVATGNP
ncbi:TVP38/TMEM64 family protein [Stackebrandtia soli]|uniref:TVP38/TMEM64 family protein n=1 Tax=Stackebrandtia soli TaxID=1892856 RepID=UPI0039E8FB2E